MKTIQADEETWCYIQLMTFILGIGMEVLHHYFEQKILKDVSFFIFLESNKHLLYHGCYPKIKCCECFRNPLAGQSKQACLDKSQFEILFEKSPTTDLQQNQTGCQETTKYCLCQIEAKRCIEVDCMDITLMFAIINTCLLNQKYSIHGNPKNLKTIKDTRNYLVHAPGQRISRSVFEIKMAETEQAILGIASVVGNYFAITIKRKVKAFRTDELSINTIKQIIESNADDIKEVGIRWEGF